MKPFGSEKLSFERELEINNRKYFVSGTYWYEWDKHINEPELPEEHYRVESIDKLIRIKLYKIQLVTLEICGKMIQGDNIFPRCPKALQEKLCDLISQNLRR